MYLQITTRCNMKCAHCCYSCTEKGQDMSRDIAFKALKYAENMGDAITIGGGEPTVHPLFWDILGLSLVHVTDDMNVHVITNGKNSKDAIKLASLAKRGVIGAEVSQDRWHEPISDEVYEAFTKDKRDYIYNNDHRPPDMRGVRSVKTICKQGRGRNIAGAKVECCCDDLVVDPEGKLFACGCKREQFGTIFYPEVPQEYYERDSKCSKAAAKERARARVEPVPA